MIKRKYDNKKLSHVIYQENFISLAYLQIFMFFEFRKKRRIFISNRNLKDYFISELIKRIDKGNKTHIKFLLCLWKCLLKKRINSRLLRILKRLTYISLKEMKNSNSLFATNFRQIINFVINNSKMFQANIMQIMHSD